MVSRALLDVVETLAAEFPAVPLRVIYDKVGDARPISARYLPNVFAYSKALEGEARVALERDMIEKQRASTSRRPAALTPVGGLEGPTWPLGPAQSRSSATSDPFDRRPALPVEATDARPCLCAGDEAGAGMSDGSLLWVRGSGVDVRTICRRDVMVTPARSVR
jgi:hypothetical protein